MSFHVHVHSPRSQVSQFVVVLRLKLFFLHVNVSCKDMISMGSVSCAYIFFWVPDVPGYQTAVCVCVNVLFGGGYLAAGITRLLRDVLKQKALWGLWEKAGIVTTDVCVRLSVCVFVCVSDGDRGLRKCGGRKRKGEGCFWVTDSHCCCLLCRSMKTSSRPWHSGL